MDATNDTPQTSLSTQDEQTEGVVDSTQPSDPPIPQSRQTLSYDPSVESDDQLSQVSDIFSDHLPTPVHDDLDIIPSSAEISNHVSISTQASSILPEVDGMRTSLIQHAITELTSRLRDHKLGSRAPGLRIDYRRLVYLSSLKLPSFLVKSIPAAKN